MPHHYNLPLTYTPKLTPVKTKQCRQTIRLGNKKKVGDYVRFFTWAGRPYHSRWVWVLEEYQELTEVIDIKIYPTGFKGKVMFHPWDSTLANLLAHQDFISPPTGIELGKVLMGKNKIPDEGVVGQILRWG